MATYDELTASNRAHAEGVRARTSSGTAGPEGRGDHLHGRPPPPGEVPRPGCR